jgi:putative transcriptional regulator
MTKKTKTSRLTKELLETAGQLRKVGLLNRAAHEKITMRQLGAARSPKLAPIAGEQRC